LVLLLLGSFFIIATPASADSGSASRYEQYRYAMETINLSYESYVQRQGDFRAAGCTRGWPNTSAGCTKPAPYNQFDWTDDGCSGAELAWGAGHAVTNWYRNLFNAPCRLHDFGYRNLGKGLALYRHEDTRRLIDARFLVEMHRLCQNNFQGFWKTANRVQCVTQAELVYQAVSNYNRLRANWGTSGTPPTAPQAPRLINLTASVSGKDVTITLRAFNLRSGTPQAGVESAFVFYTCYRPDGQEWDHPRWWLFDEHIISGSPADGTWRSTMTNYDNSGVTCRPTHVDLHGADGTQLSFSASQLTQFTSAPFTLP
jgi:hypothetical protein